MDNYLQFDIHDVVCCVGVRQSYPVCDAGGCGSVLVAGGVPPQGNLKGGYSRLRIAEVHPVDAYTGVNGGVGHRLKATYKSNLRNRKHKILLKVKYKINKEA